MTVNKRVVTRGDRTGTDQALAAAAAFPTLKEAAEYMNSIGYTITEKHLEVKRRNLPERYDEIRAELAATMQTHLANDLGGLAHLSTTAAEVGIKQTLKAFEDNRIQPHEAARVARDVMQVATQAMDKQQLLLGNPTSIVENRSVQELEKSLVALGVAEVIDSTAVEETDA